MNFPDIELNEEQRKVLGEACAIHNAARRVRDPGYGPLTPEEYLKDIVTRYIEGLREATADEKAMAERMRLRHRSARERLGMFGATNAPD